MGASPSTSGIESQLDLASKTDYINPNESANTLRKQNPMDSDRSEENVSSSSSQASMSNRSSNKSDSDKFQNHGRRMLSTSGIKSFKPKLKSHIDYSEENCNP